MQVIASIYYKYKLRSYLKRRDVQRQFLCLKDAKRILVAFNCDDYSHFSPVEKMVKSLFEPSSNVAFVVFINADKVDDILGPARDKEILIFRNDLVRKKTPSEDIVRQIDDIKADVFINMEQDSSEVIDFLTLISNAKMRVSYAGKERMSELAIDVTDTSNNKKFLSRLFQLWSDVEFR